MASAKFVIGAVGVTSWLIVRARAATAPSAEVARKVFAGPQPQTRNIQFDNLAPVEHYFDYYESADGTALTTLLGTWSYDVRNDVVIMERRFYRVGSTTVPSPNAGETTLADPYLNGKNITGVFQRSFGFLQPTQEWQPFPGGGFQLLGGLSFFNEDVYMVEISYAQPAAFQQQSGFVEGRVVLVDAENALTSTHYNKRMDFNGSGSRQSATLPAIAPIPDGKFFYFTHQRGTQKMALVKLTDGTIKFNGEDLTEVALGKGESIWLEKQDQTFEVVGGNHPGLLYVGERISATYKDHPNTLPEDNSLYDADDYPRLWKWLTTKLTSALVITDDNVDALNYARTKDLNGKVFRPGQFVISVTKKKFRTPDTRGLTERALIDFTNYGTDPERLADVPGGFQYEQVGTHFHETGTNTQAGQAPFNRARPHNTRSWNETPKSNPNDTASTELNKKDAGTGAEYVNTAQRNENLGVIYLRRY